MKMRIVIAPMNVRAPMCKGLRPLRLSRVSLWGLFVFSCRVLHTVYLTVAYQAQFYGYEGTYGSAEVRASAGGRVSV